jgi:hypothetical protein
MLVYVVLQYGTCYIVGGDVCVLSRSLIRGSCHDAAMVEGYFVCLESCAFSVLT